jgi:hypothetical protein
MTQLTEKIREALLGNVGTIICGRIGVTDAELMVKAFSPVFTAEDLTKTPNFAAVTKVMMFDMPSAPFTINLPPPMGEPDDELMKSLKAYSATKFAKTRAEVEKEIQDRWNAASKAKEEPEKTAGSDFNDALNTALKAQNISGVVQQATDSLAEVAGVKSDAMREILRYMQEYYSTPITYPQLQSAMKPILDLYSGTEYAHLQQTLREIASYQKSPGYNALVKQMRESNALSAALKDVIPTLEAIRKNTDGNAELNHLERETEKPTTEEEEKNADA